MVDAPHLPCNGVANWSRKVRERFYCSPATTGKGDMTGEIRSIEADAEHDCRRAGSGPEYLVFPGETRRSRHQNLIQSLRRLIINSH